MLRGPIILLAATVGFVLLIAPSLSTVEPDESRPVPAGASAAPAGSGDETVLERSEDGHFYADALVNAGKTHMLVDTGASVVALTGEDATALGIRWDEVDAVPVGRGAGGTVMGIPVRLDSIEVGGITARDVDAIVVPHGLDVSLLGQSFLKQVDNVEIGDDRLVLS